MEERVRDLEIQAAKIQSHIGSELGNINKTISEIRLELKENHNETKTEIEKIRKILVGNGSLGLDSRVHELENTHSSWKKYMLAVWVALLSVIGKLVFFPTK